MKDLFFCIFFFMGFTTNAQFGPPGPHDTIPSLVYKNGVDLDSFPFQWNEWHVVRGPLTEKGKQKMKERYRLRYFVEKTYPLAIEAADLINEIRREKLEMETKKEKRKFLKSKEKEIKSKFTDSIKNMSIERGKVLNKLICRETGMSTYDLVKEMKSGVNARFWQTVAFFFDGNLKTTYKPEDEDYEIELIVKELARAKGRN